MPPLLVHHVRQGVIAGNIRGAGVDPHHQIETLGWRVEDRLHPDGSGIVHQDVEAAEFGDRALDQAANGVLVADVGGDGKGAPAHGADGIRGFMDAAGRRWAPWRGGWGGRAGRGAPRGGWASGFSGGRGGGPRVDPAFWAATAT